MTHPRAQRQVTQPRKIIFAHLCRIFFGLVIQILFAWQLFKKRTEIPLLCLSVSYNLAWGHYVGPKIVPSANNLHSPQLHKPWPRSLLDRARQKCSECQRERRHRSNNGNHRHLGSSRDGSRDSLAAQFLLHSKRNQVTVYALKQKFGSNRMMLSD